MNQKEKMAYLAGIIDGEGHLEVRKTITSVGNVCYSARMSFFMRDKIPTELFVNIFGGKILTTKMAGKKYYGVSLNGSNLEKILIKLLPYLQIRKQLAMCLLDLIKNRKEFPPHPIFKEGKFRGTLKMPVSIQKERKRLFEDCKLLQNFNRE